MKCLYFLMLLAKMLFFLNMDNFQWSVVKKDAFFAAGWYCYDFLLQNKYLVANMLKIS